jgi:hypothetical protein
MRPYKLLLLTTLSGDGTLEEIGKDLRTGFLWAWLSWCRLQLWEGGLVDFLSSVELVDLITKDILAAVL